MMEAFVDGACRISNPGQAASSFVLYEDGKEIDTWAVVHPGLNTNNFAEYMALLGFLIQAKKKGWKNVRVYSDSKLVVMQSTNQWKVKPELRNFAQTAHDLLVYGDHEIYHMRGHEKDEHVELHIGNNRADELCNEILDIVQAREGKSATK